MRKRDFLTFLIRLTSSNPKVYISLTVFLLASSLAMSQHLPSITKMPDFPPNYEMRDWKKTARDFDFLVFDSKRNGDFLPLIWTDKSRKVNDFEGFAIPSYVGDLRQNAKTNTHEAITGIAAVLGGTLAGLDKSEYATMIPIHYHKKNKLGLYLNQAGTRGDSFWYDLLPSLLFVQVFDRHPGIKEFQEQFNSTADKWLAIFRKLDGNFNHTGYDFYEESSVDRGWNEADVVTGIACLQYYAWQKTGIRKYLEACEMALEWMDRRVENPFYESLVPYGAYTSARFNATHGTSYDTAKFIEWVLAGDNPRKWGAMLETWNQTPVHGLIGSVYPQYEYAFCMNSFQAVGIMAPIARYEDKYARDLAKWILNVAANGRYFYPDAWPAKNQSSFEWASNNDPNFCIPYEGIRKLGKTRDYPSNDQMKKGAIKLGHSTNPDKDMILTANEKGSIHYEGTIEVPSGTSHTLIAVVNHRSVENDTRVFIKGENKHAIQFKNQRSDILKMPIQSSGRKQVVIQAEGLPPNEVIQVKDLVIETGLENPPHVGGDAVDHEWGNTDLALYGGSYAGFLGALIETTNVRGILAINPVATEVMLPDAYPTRLFFNPFEKPHTVNWNLGTNPVQVYDAINNTKVKDSAAGFISFEIAPKNAVMLVFPPAEKPMKIINSKLICDGIVVDFKP